MNFCGIDQRTVFDTEPTSSSSTLRGITPMHTFHCNVSGCVKDVVLLHDDDDDDINVNHNHRHNNNHNDDDDDDDDDIDAFLNVEQQLLPVSTDLSNDPEVSININDVTKTAAIARTITTTSETNCTINTTETKVVKPIAQIALDNIQQTIEEIYHKSSKSLIVADVVNIDHLYNEDDEDDSRDDNNSILPTLHTKHFHQPLSDHSDDIVHNTPISSLDSNTSPNVNYSNSNNSSSIMYTSSPSYLNPLDTSQWTETRDGIEIIRRPELLCPILEPLQSTTSSTAANTVAAMMISPSKEALLVRLEQGFRIRPFNGLRSIMRTQMTKMDPAIPNTTTPIDNYNYSSNNNDDDPLITIYLHPDRTRICFGSVDIIHGQSNQLHMRRGQQHQTYTGNPSRTTTSISPSRDNNRHQWLNGNIEKSNNNTNNNKSKQLQLPLMEIMVNDILRLEIGGQNTKSFSIIRTEEESGRINDYTFEATCVIDREVIVSTLLLLLDQFHNSQQLYELGDDDDVLFGWIDETDGGTMDKPIPCSPSLDEPIDIETILSQHQQSIISCSPSLETERVQNSYHYIANQQGQSTMYTASTATNDNFETESGDIIHLEDISISDSNVSRVLGQWSRRASSSLGLVQQNSNGGSDEIEDTVTRLDCKASVCSSNHIYGGNTTATTTNNTNIGANNISQTVWCSGDTCALALHDIAETCTGIFALKQNESICSPSLGVEQRVAVEEFIASALGTSTVVYSYLTEGGDIWNSKASVAATDAKNGTIHRNRATILNAQAARLRALRNEMTFATALKQSKERMQFVQTVQSFDDAYNRAGTKKLRAATEAANRLHTSPLLQSIVRSMKMHDADGNSTIEENDNNNVVYYDSDPEDSRPRNATKGPRRIVQTIYQQQSDQIMDEMTDSPRGALAGMDDIISPIKISKKLDEETIVEIVQVSVTENFR
jgi:hypothetical protein